MPRLAETQASHLNTNGRSEGWSTATTPAFPALAALSPAPVKPSERSVSGAALDVRTRALASRTANFSSLASDIFEGAVKELSGFEAVERTATAFQKGAENAGTGTAAFG